MDGGGLTVLIVDVCRHIVLSWDRFQPPPPRISGMDGSKTVMGPIQS